jgi:two-component system, sensor histidine kinase and response regulator
MSEFKRRVNGQSEPAAGRQTHPDGFSRVLVAAPDQARRPAPLIDADWPAPGALYSYTQDLEELRGQNRELQERVMELDAFAQTVAHDLKGPLASLGGLARELKEDDGRLSAAQREECLDHLVHSASKLNAIIDELLLLAQIRQSDVVMEPLHMAVTVAEARKRLAFLIEDCQAEIVLPAEWPMAEGHDLWVEEVWVNYLSNAIQYGGLPPRVELGAERQANGMIRFWVRDNGRGLTPREQARLFKPFTRLENRRAGGHGLGLSVVQRIVDKLGGQVGIESIPGQGSIFSFTLRGC